MTIIKAIACVSSTGGLGYEGKLLGHLPEDLEHFKSMTLNQAVFMGADTAKSLPGGKPLADRTNFVLCQAHEAIYYSLAGFISVVAPTAAQGLAIATTECDKEVLWIIGGAKMYTELLRYAESLYLTIAPQLPLKADKYFPMCQLRENWTQVNVSHLSHSGISIMLLRNEEDTNVIDDAAMGL